ncbi:MAG: chorismate synthase, partial [Alphaproteobacteria bacterium]
NSFGQIFRFTTWGESHGPAIGVVVDGVPPHLPFTEADAQVYLDRRRPGQSRFTTQRREPDAVKIISGVFEGVTTGTPVAMMLENVDQRSKDYSEIAARYRPGHADYTYDAKYGIRDYRGGGRSSARETASRVAAGALARKVIDALTGGTVEIRGALVQIGEMAITGETRDWTYAGENVLWCPDPSMTPRWETYLNEIRKSGSSVGAVIEIVASGVPVGLGEPIYGKIDSDLAAAMMTINAVKGVEIGAGMGAAALTGEENADEMRMNTSSNGGDVTFGSNNAGGVLGGITTGQDLVVRFAVKPTSSILAPRATVSRDGTDTEVSTKGRHDPCVGIRAVPVGEAMMATVIADHLLRHRAQIGDFGSQNPFAKQAKSAK